MNLTIEQRKRVNNFQPTFYRYLREGTLQHCRKLYKAGMISEAFEIAGEFRIKKEEINLSA